MKRAGLRLLGATGAVAATATAAAWIASRKDLEQAARLVAEERQVIESEQGVIEFAECGDGPAVLVVHGAGGGFDQGLALGRAILGDAYRIVAPSRFGYLGTPVPADASAEAQADAHARLLDALGLENVPVIAASAGAPSAMQFCLRHPERCSALVLIVPLAWAPDRTFAPPSRLFATVLTTIAASDFVFWTMMRVAPLTLLKTILGTPVEAYRNASHEERETVTRMLQTMLPIRRRVAGMQNDGVVAAGLKRYALEEIHVPTLVVSAVDCLYGTYDSSFYTAEEIAEARFVGFASGGHLLLGHDAELRSLIRDFLLEARFLTRGGDERQHRVAARAPH